ncbi:hypothetical protein METUNv1_03055 [Methyloversatilis universalis FAM5]|jgi:hypothetical protein|uniref:Transmembrane protein n=1 Tax=Methyloversatilis universalis (strain ATCC BAA-1314 / DSM 25237 / JCM 13912 / CCUG 52030 / FAM5) TaxID=1000565 RepID=F5RFH4_METUF|nr:hypothetical protein [Methyloversatilis universalis]EGK70830.1 hypothetical protein METUNv1_03055 [Methyloversatilis universalis FAM5]
MNIHSLLAATLLTVSPLLSAAGGSGHVPVTPLGPEGYGQGMSGASPGGMIGQHPRELIRPNARSRTTDIYPTVRGTQIRDYSKPGVRIEEDANGTRVYQMRPYSNVRDYDQPGWRIERRE